MKASLLYRCYDETGEAATWLDDPGIFLWVNIEGGILHEYCPDTQKVTNHWLPDMVSTILPCTAEEVILALKGRLIRYHLKNKTITDLTSLESDNPSLRPNDGKASPEGRCWLGIMHLSDHNHTGALCCIEPDLSYRKVLTGQCIPNGIVWDKKGNTMYYVDSGRRCIEAYAYDRESGSISNPRTVVQILPSLGVPDGMAIDDNGLLWVAHWGGGAVYIWDPHTGQPVGKIEVPVPLVASCTFGGKNKDKLFITTARAGMTPQELEAYPLSGSLFVADVPPVSTPGHYPFVVNR